MLLATHRSLACTPNVRLAHACGLCTTIGVASEAAASDTPACAGPRLGARPAARQQPRHRAYTRPQNPFQGSTDWAHVRNRYAYQRPRAETWQDFWSQGLRREQARSAHTRSQMLLLLGTFAAIWAVDSVSTSLWQANNHGVRSCAMLARCAAARHAARLGGRWLSRGARSAADRGAVVCQVTHQRAITCCAVRRGFTRTRSGRRRIRWARADRQPCTRAQLRQMLPQAKRPEAHQHKRRTRACRPPRCWAPCSRCSARRYFARSSSTGRRNRTRQPWRPRRRRRPRHLLRLRGRARHSRALRRGAMPPRARAQWRRSRQETKAAVCRWRQCSEALALAMVRKLTARVPAAPARRGAQPRSRRPAPALAWRLLTLESLQARVVAPARHQQFGRTRTRCLQRADLNVMGAL